MGPFSWLDVQAGKLLSTPIGIVVAALLKFPPAVRVPDFAVVVQTDDHRLIVNVRVFAQIRRQVDAPLSVGYHIRRATQDQPAEIPHLGIGQRPGADFFGELVPRVGRVKPQARVNALGNDQERDDPS